MGLIGRKEKEMRPEKVNSSTPDLDLIEKYHPGEEFPNSLGGEMKPTGYDYKGDVKKTAKTEVDKLSDMIKTTLPKEEQLEVVIHNLVAEVANLRVANEALQDSVDWEKL